MNNNAFIMNNNAFIMNKNVIIMKGRAGASPAPTIANNSSRFIIQIITNSKILTYATKILNRWSLV